MLRLGTRASPMALAQARLVAGLLAERAPEVEVRLVPTTTTADRWDGDLAVLGGKGLFVTAIDERLLNREVDVAVHCVKDLPGDVDRPDELVTAAYLSRADVADVLVVPDGAPAATLEDLPSGARIGTSAVRRAAQLRRMRPDLAITRVRGAVGTRLAELDRGTTPLDAMVVAAAGLDRLGLADRARQRFTPRELLPAVGAGVLTVECHRDDDALTGLLAALDHAATRRAVTAERALLRGLRGHCNSPIAGHCRTLPDGRLHLRGIVFTPDGTRMADAEHRAAPGGDPAELGRAVCADLVAAGAQEIIAAIPH